MTLRNAFVTLPVTQRLRITFKIRNFEGGKEVSRKYIKKLQEAMPLQSISKITK